MWWVHNHFGIRGIEEVYSAAKSALDLPRVSVGVPYSNFKHHINQYILFTFQDDWSGAVAIKETSFCQAGPWRLAVFLQAVQEELSYSSDPSIHLEKNILHLSVSTGNVF